MKIERNVEIEVRGKYESKGDITCFIKDKEMLKICNNGDFYVKGKKVINDIDVYKGFKAWLTKARD